MICSSSGEMRLSISSRRDRPATAMQASRSVITAISPVVLFRVSHICPEKSPRPPIREYFLKMTPPSLSV